MSSPNGPTEAADGLSPIMRRRLQDREEWAAFWKIRELDAKGKIVPTIHYYAQRYLIDWPVTFVREKLIEPLNDRFRKPYYHRKLTRVPDIDQCGVNDKACIYEANEQFRLDKLVDTYIMNILKIRTNRCITYHDPYLAPCAPLMEEFEEAELNWFIKYGELGSEAEAVDVYMKQKHRMIWERRHPEIMAERQRAYEEHKEKLRQGVFDQSFWKKGLIYMDKKLLNPPYDYQPTKMPIESDQPLSKDWAYYKKLQEDPEFDKQQGKQSNIPLI
ncbi:NADH dehydrogenase [ubiquinone] 1 beta subcomplex subunit 10 [Aphelenchoides fujianensis]|nr:NADH dehydrogenase [ubiquinone] 1 beta subcomplex subunit 10 [Aphelenchoides fujianensis]